MVKAMSWATKYIKLEENQRLERREKSKSSRKSKVVMEVAEPHVTPRPRQVATNSSRIQCQNMDLTNDPFKFCLSGITPNSMVKHLEIKDYVR